MKRDPPLEPYAAWRARATGLSRHYSGLYRGAFLLNYGLAVGAVILAALSLVLLVFGYLEMSSITATHPVATDSAAIHGRPDGTHEAKADHLKSPMWLIPSLVVLGLGKLWILDRIVRNTDEANHGDWNDKAVDYRYLAERLRTMLYLPRLGSFQPPAAAEHHYVARSVRQSAVDWLFDAIVRSISPAELPIAHTESIMGPDGSTLGKPAIIRLSAIGVLRDVRDLWVYQQSEYHHQTARHNGAAVQVLRKRRGPALQGSHRHCFGGLSYARH